MKLNTTLLLLGCVAKSVWAYIGGFGGSGYGLGRGFGGFGFGGGFGGAGFGIGFGFPWLGPPLDFQTNSGSVFGSHGVGFYLPPDTTSSEDTSPDDDTAQFPLNETSSAGIQQRPPTDIAIGAQQKPMSKLPAVASAAVPVVSANVDPGSIGGLSSPDILSAVSNTGVRGSVLSGVTIPHAGIVPLVPVKPVTILDSSRDGAGGGSAGALAHVSF